MLAFLRGTAQPLIAHFMLHEKNILLTGSSSELIQMGKHSILSYRKIIDILAFQNTIRLLWEVQAQKSEESHHLLEFGPKTQGDVI